MTVPREDSGLVRLMLLMPQHLQRLFLSGFSPPTSAIFLEKGKINPNLIWRHRTERGGMWAEEQESWSAAAAE